MNETAETLLLAQKEISVTPIRLLVLQTFLKHPQAFSLKDLEEKLFYSERSTIFRTLQLFQKKGVLHEIISSDGIKRWRFLYSFGCKKTRCQITGLSH